jgi:hypothetical protein
VAGADAEAGAALCGGAVWAGAAAVWATAVTAATSNIATRILFIPVAPSFRIGKLDSRTFRQRVLDAGFTTIVCTPWECSRKSFAARDKRGSEIIPVSGL